MNIPEELATLRDDIKFLTKARYGMYSMLMFYQMQEEILYEILLDEELKPHTIPLLQHCAELVDQRRDREMEKAFKNYE